MDTANLFHLIASADNNLANILVFPDRAAIWYYGRMSSMRANKILRVIVEQIYQRPPLPKEVVYSQKHERIAFYDYEVNLDYEPQFELLFAPSMLADKSNGRDITYIEVRGVITNANSR